MNCSDIRSNIDDCIDGYLNETEHKKVINHIAQCSLCKENFQQRTDLIQLIASTKSQIPEPSPDLADKIIRARKSKKNASRIRRRRWSIAISAIAASLAVLAIIPGLNPVTIRVPDQNPILTHFSLPTLHEPHTIGLLFKSKQHLENVTFSIEIPPEIELQGFSGKRKLKWRGNLKQGKNLISVPVIARSATSGILIMSLEHIKDVKTFKVQLDSNDDNGRHNNGVSLRFMGVNVS